MCMVTYRMSYLACQGNIYALHGHILQETGTTKKEYLLGFRGISGNEGYEIAGELRARRSRARRKNIWPEERRGQKCSRSLQGGEVSSSSGHTLRCRTGKRRITPRSDCILPRGRGPSGSQLPRGREHCRGAG